MANVHRLVELGMVQPVARRVTQQITAQTGNRKPLIELGKAPALAKRMEAMITAKTVDVRVLAELGMPTEHIREFRKQVLA